MSAVRKFPERTAETIAEEIFRREAEDQMDDRRYFWRARLDLCGSEIERALLAAMIVGMKGSVSGCVGDGQWIYGDGTRAAPGDIDDHPRTNGIHIWMQAPIGKYRADFLVICKIDSKRWRFVVECDGHDFHERTKEQAQRDRERDRTMTALGYVVVRFTGSEIWRDAEACISHLDQVMSGVIEGQQ